MKSRFLRGCINKCKKMGSRVLKSSCAACCEDCCERALWSSLHDENESSSNCSSNNIPSDVPRGHMVVYVGENHTRYVIKIALLHHPLFRALLDQAQEEYDFIADSKLCIPCDENLFLNVIRCATSTHNQRACLCLWEIIIICIWDIIVSFQFMLMLSEIEILSSNYADDISYMCSHYNIL